MIQQPDTRTMEGRHAVERASLKFRIQRSHSFKSNNWGDLSSALPDCPAFSWIPYDYRIHPDDLQAWHDSQKRDVWTASNHALTLRGIERGEFYQNAGYTVEELLDALNGDRCGVRKGGG